MSSLADCIAKAGKALDKFDRQILEDALARGLSGEDALALLESEIAGEQQELIDDTGITPKKVKDGRDFEDFFSGVTKGTEGVPFDRNLKPVVTSVIQDLADERSAVSGYHMEYTQYEGNFDDHIALSIPGYRENQYLIGMALLDTFGSQNATMLDIGASEGTQAKTITSLSGGNIKTISMDPNPDMADTFGKTPAPEGATYSFAAFADTAEQEGQLAWTEDDGREVHYFDSQGQKFDIVHEAMTFQFINNDRATHVKRVAEMTKDDGVAIFQEKLHNENWAFNESSKNQFKALSFRKSDLTRKAAEVLEGMNENMVTIEQLEQELAANFKYWGQIWDSGNFRGYVATNSQERFNQFMGNLRDTSSPFDTRQGRQTIALEVAPNPADQDASARFSALTLEQQDQVTRAVAEEIIPTILKQMGVKYYNLEFGTGGYLDKVSPSINLTIRDTGADVARIGRAIGMVLRQAEIVHADTGRTGGITTFVHTPAEPLTPEQQQELYDSIRTDVPEVTGYSTVGGALHFANFSELEDAKFAEKLTAALGAPVTEQHYYTDLLESSKDEPELADIIVEAGRVYQRQIRLAELERYADTDGREDGVLVRPPVSGGQITLVHYSNSASLQSIDPAYFGTNHKGADFARSREENWVNRAYYGIEPGEPGGYKVEWGVVGNNPYTVSLPASLMYDANTDPDGLYSDLQGSNPKAKFNHFEKKIKEAGYAGYWANQPSLGMIAAVFDKVTLPGSQRYTELQQSAVTLRRGTETLRRWGLEPGDRPTTRELGEALEARTRAKWGTVAKDDRSEDAKQKLAKWIVQEIKFELEHAEDSGVGWYGEKYHRALDILALDYPELADSQEARDMFTAFLAITSNGQKAIDNFKHARDIYSQYRETGKISDTLRSHARIEGMKSSLDALQKLIDEKGVKGTHEFLMGEDTVKNLKKNHPGFKSPSYTVDMTLPMAAAVFGDKVGVFYANLMGSHSYLTMDRWWSRTFNRYRGTLVKRPTNAGLDRYRGLIGQPDMTDEEVLLHVIGPRGDYFGRKYKTRLEIKLGRKKGKLKDPAWDAITAGQDPGLIEEDRIERAANTIYKAAYEELEDTPFNASDRKFMVDTVKHAQRSLKRSGIEMSLADIQATLWYYEKRLYTDMGAKDSRVVSFEEAARETSTRSRGRVLFQSGTLPMDRESRLARARAMGFDTDTVWYHGTDKAGFLEFDIPTAGKTEGTGVFFTNNRTMAKGYQRGRGDPVVFPSAEEVFEDNDIIEDFEVVTSFSVINESGETVEGGYSSIEEAQEEWELDAGDSFAEVFTIYHRGYDLGTFSKEEALEVIESDVLSARGDESGVYEVYLKNIPDEDMLIVDFGGNNWNEAPIESWALVENDEVIDWTYTEEEAQSWVAKGGNREYFSEDAKTTDDYVREAVDMGLRGVLFKNVYDSGPHSRGADSGDVRVMLDPSDIRHVDAAFIPSAIDSRNILHQSRTPRGMYSAAERAVLEMKLPAFNPSKKNPDGSARGDDIWNKLKSTPGVKQDELFWIGAEQYLTEDPARRFTREQVAEFFRKNGVRVDEVVSEEKTGGLEMNSISWSETLESLNDYFDQNDIALEDRVYEIRSSNTPLVIHRRAGESNWKLYDSSVQEVGGSSFHFQSPAFNEVVVRAQLYAEVMLYVKPRDVAPTKHGMYTMEGVRTDYREVRLTLPELETDYYNKNHFEDRNIVAFLRVSHRREFGYFLEEMQSDMHQHGRRVGYKGPNDRTLDEIQREIEELMETRASLMSEVAKDLNLHHAEMTKIVASEQTDVDDPRVEEIRKLSERYKDLYAERDLASHGVPDAPFKNDEWMTLALKRALVDAVDRGEKTFSWADAQVHINRWSDEYAELYNNTYNKKIVSIIKKLTGQHPEHVKVGRAEGGAGLKAVAVFHGHDTHTMEDWWTSLSDEGREKAFADYEDSTREGVWTVPITDELVSRIKGEGFPLFQPERGRILLNDDQRIIQLASASDLSTFLHETSHLFLEMEKFYAGKYGLSENQRAILQWLGLDSFDDITTEDHERWAETFEVYLREGKAPSLGLRRAFAAFARWLKIIYRQLTHPGLSRAELGPEITEVFNRLLATQEELEVAAANPQYDQFFRSKEQSGMSDAQWEEYQARAARVKETAERTLDEKVLEQYMRTKRQEWREEKEPLIEKEKDRISKEPIYQVMSDLKAFKDEDGVAGEGRMDTSRLRDLFPDGKIPGRFIGKHVKEGGIDPQLYAEAYGFTSAQDMVDQIMAAPTLNEAADAAAEAIMVERHGDILNDGTLEQEVREALINEDHAAMLAIEINALRKSKTEPGVNRTYLKFEAESTIARMKYSEIRPDRYYRAMIKAAKDAVTVKDPAEAKLRELSNHYLYKAALEARETMEKNRRFIRATKTREYSTTKVQQSYIKQIKMLAEMYDMRDKNAQLKALDEILNFYSAQEKEGDEMVDLSLLDPNLINALRWREEHGQTLAGFSPVQFDDMTGEDLQGVVDMLKHLRYVGGQIADMRGTELAADRARLTQWIRDNGGKDHPIQRGKKRGQSVAKEWNHLVNTMPSLANMVRKLDGHKDGGLVFEMIYQVLKDALDTKLDMNHKFYDEFKDLMGDISKIGLSHYGPENWQVRWHLAANDAKNFQLENGESIQFTSEERFMMALYWGTQSSRDAIKDAWGMTDNDVMTILSTLNADQLHAVNTIWAMNESQWPDLRDAAVAMLGVAPPKLQAVPFVVNGVQMNGGHMQLFYDSERIELSNEQESARRTSAIMPNKAGSLNARKGSGGRKVDLDINNVARSVDDKIHYIAFAQAGRRLRQLIHPDSEISAAIERKHGPGFLKAFAESIDGITGGRLAQETHRSGAKISKYMRQNATLMHLAYSIRNTVQQVSAVPIAMKEVGPIRWAQAALRTYGFHRDAVKMIHDKSKFMENRAQVVNREASEFMKQMVETSKLGYKWEQFRSHSFVLQTTVDKWVAYPTWLAAYENAMEKHGDEKRARTEADNSVAQTVGSGSDLHLGRIMQSNQNEWVKTLTVFGSWFNAYYQRLYKSSKGGEDFLNIQFAADALVLPILVSTLTQALILDTPDEDEEFEEYVWKNTYRFLLGTVPVINQLATFIDGYTPTAPISNLSSSMYRLPKELEAFAEGEQTGLKTIVDVGRVTTGVIPVPGSGQVWRALDYYDSWLSGEEDGFNPYQMLTEGRDKDG